MEILKIKTHKNVVKKRDVHKSRLCSKKLKNSKKTQKIDKQILLDKNNFFLNFDRQKEVYIKLSLDKQNIRQKINKTDV
mgnify:CR=1 FL=1